jgi:dTDP-glucose 4,6-dehydratase
MSSDVFLRSNVNGVHNLLRLISEKKEKPVLIHFSTDEVYGDSPKYKRENDLMVPSNPYAATKAAADMLILAWARTHNTPYLIIRPSNNYGDGQYVEKLIPVACKNLGLKKKIKLHNSGHPSRTWLHVSDTVSALMTMIDFRAVNEIYNVSGNFTCTNMEIVMRIIAHYYNEDTYFSIDPNQEYCVVYHKTGMFVPNNYKGMLDLTYNRPGQDSCYLIDDSKLRSLGWKPEAMFDLELKKTVNYNKNNKFVW